MAVFLYGALATLGVFFVYLGVKAFQETKTLLADGKRTKAEVIDLITIYDRRYTLFL